MKKILFLSITALLMALSGGLWWNASSRLDHLHVRLQQAQAEWQAARMNRFTLQRQLHTAKGQSGKMLTVGPDESGLLEWLQSEQKGTGAVVVGVAFDASPGSGNGAIGVNLHELPAGVELLGVSLTLRGDSGAVKQFLTDVGVANRYMVVEGLSVVTAGSGKVEATLHLGAAYRQVVVKKP